MKLSLILIACFCFLLGCKDNPYDGKPATQKIKPEPSPSEQAQPNQPQGPNDATLRYSLSLAEVMLFNEGTENGYTAKGSVPAPGRVILTFTNLPAGMNYNATQGSLTWKPDYTAADDPQHPYNYRKVIVAQAQLKSDLDPVSVVTKDFVIVVEDTVQVNPQPTE